jgi:hypothetical protein
MRRDTPELARIRPNNPALREIPQNPHPINPNWPRCPPDNPEQIQNPVELQATNSNWTKQNTMR